jgi:hypothetical protein
MITEESMESMTEEELIEYLVKKEFETFDKTRNAGGRASCQDDWETFYIMRKSQYLTWTRPMLISMICDFENTSADGWNMITEKYARMMESTVPEEYEKLKDKLPPVSEQKKAIVEQVVFIQVKWMEEFAAAHPNVSMHARSIHTSEDTFYSTSAETYLRGELLTYSDETLALYARFIVDLAKQNKNLTEMIMYHTIKMYGYETFDDVKEM